MGLPRTFIGFSSTDIHNYRLMQAWKAHEHIDLNFTDCQLGSEIYSENDGYIKSKCRERINMAGTFAMLIGNDTKSKHKYVRWEMKVAIEKKCKIVGINLNMARAIDNETCPSIIKDIGAIFVPFSPKIIAHALEHYSMLPRGNYHYPDSVYTGLGY